MGYNSFLSRQMQISNQSTGFIVGITKSVLFAFRSDIASRLLAFKVNSVFLDDYEDDFNVNFEFSVKGLKSQQWSREISTS